MRGRWGEIQLRRVVEMAGMLDHCDFVHAGHARSEKTAGCGPTCWCALPAGKTIVVDAKTPLDAYLRAMEAPDEQTRKARLADHARQVRTHMAALGRKSYWEQFDHAPGVRGAVPARASASSAPRWKATRR